MVAKAVPPTLAKDEVPVMPPTVIVIVSEEDMPGKYFIA
jgi:hypothetical protein